MKFRKKPVIIDAVQFTKEDSEKSVFCFEYENQSGGKTMFQWAVLCNGESGPGSKFLAIATLEGNMKADVGDWIARGIKGEFYPVKPDIFEATYEPEVEDLTAPDRRES